MQNIAEGMEVQLAPLDVEEVRLCTEVHAYHARQSEGGHHKFS